MPSSASRPARCARWWPRHRWNWASISATSSWCASSARTRSISTFVQRVGRANHAVGGVPKGRLFPLSRDDLVECAALLHAVRAGELDALNIPPQPLDVLSQQLVAEVSAREYGEDELYALVRRAWPYRALPRHDFDAAAAHAGGRRQHPARAPERLSAPRRGQSSAARAPRRAPDRDHLRRRHSRQRRLPGGARAGRHVHRYAERGFRRRESGRRRVPARQLLLPHPAGRGRAGAGRRRQGAAADHAVLAGRGAGPQRRTVGGGVGAARTGGRVAAGDRCGSDRRTACSR